MFVYLISVLLVLHCVHSFSFLGGLHTVYQKENGLRVKVRKLASSRGLPYDFYSLPMCRPAEVRSDVENLGELLFGDRIQTSPYTLWFKRDMQCLRVTQSLKGGPEVQPTCTTDFTAEEVNRLRQLILDDYHAQMIVDKLPVAMVRSDDQCVYSGENPDRIPEYRGTTMYNVDGWALGCTTSVSTLPDAPPKVYLNNHLSFFVSYYPEETDADADTATEAGSIVTVEVIPSSVRHSSDSCTQSKPMPTNLQPIELVEGQALTGVEWTYSVEWVLSATTWASRWDTYVAGTRTSIHWYAIINSCLIVLFLTGMVAMIMVRILRKDIQQYNLEDPDEAEEAEEERGWKKLAHDVFRPPWAKSLFAVFLGSGIQILGMLLCTLPLAAIGVFAASNRGYFISTLVVLYFLMGLPAGFFGLRFYKTFDGTRWKLTTLLTAFLFPTIVFILYSSFNLIVYLGASSSVAIPFLHVLILWGLWLGIYVPLVFIGGSIGFKRAKTDLPCDIGPLPRLIERQPCYLKWPVTVIVGGILPFGAVFVELYFVMTSVWEHQLAFFFGFMLLIFAILILVTAEITIVLIYLQLCKGDYRWWWRSFMTGGFGSIYMFLFSVFYFTTLHPTSFWLGFVYFGYMAVISFSGFLLFGTVGFLASFLFVRKIYSSIRVD